jgi:hypothetical protein
VLTDWDTETIAPGLELTTFRRLEPGGWNAGSVLVANLDTEGLTLDYQYSGSVTEPGTVRSMAEADGATAAINGDFFDINKSFAPLGVGVDRDEGLVSSPVDGHNEAFAVGTDGVAHLAQVFLEGTVTAGDDELTLGGVNTYTLPSDAIGLFTSQWGEYDLSTTVSGASDVTEVTITDGVVSNIDSSPDSAPVAKNELVLVGRDSGAEALNDLQVGDAAEVSYAPRSDFGEVAVAVGGNARLVTDGQPRDFGDVVEHPRSGVGLSEDGDTMYLVTIDGRLAHAHGMTLTSFADFMSDIGAYQALNLDGGGSSTLVSRAPGTDELVVNNSPSDGNEREVSNGLGLFTEQGSRRLTGFLLTAGDGSNEALRVFPGLTRTLTALGHDETFAAVDSVPRWKSSRKRVASVEGGPDGSAIVTGHRSGDVTIAATQRRARGEATLTVLGDLRRIEPGSSLVALQGDDDEQQLSLIGYDIEGYRAPIDPGDLEIDGGEGVVELDRSGDNLIVRATTDSGSALLTLTAAGVSTQVAVTVGLEEQVVADFSDAQDWTVAFARATGSIEPIEGPDGRNGVRMSYDFVTQAGNTRAAYARPPAQFELPGQPQEITAWVEGDGNGTWIRMRVYDRNGTLVTLNGGYTTFSGWQKLSFPVPAGTEFPLTFRDVYAVQIGDVAYDGTTGFSDIAVRVAPDVELPEQSAFPDPFLVTDGTVDGAPQRIAVMSDSQFVGREPDSDIVAAARRTLQEIVAAEPDLLIINGDFVDEAATEDFDLARTILDEELGGAEFPWYYAPGNHEVQGGPIDNFIAEFGDTQHTFDIGDGNEKTRIVTLNSAFGTLRAGGDEFGQIAELRRALDEAEQDRDITGVLVFAHHPPNDPLPAANSQIADRREAAMVEKWLADFEADSGKSTAYLGAHAGVFHASSVDGVPYLVNGNSGKSPAGAPDNGGFTGWTMLGLDADEGDNDHENNWGSHRWNDDVWLQAEVIARVDELTLAAPSSLADGETGDVSATVLQDDARSVPVAWPMAAKWSGDHRVYVGDADDAPWWKTVAVDPSSGTVTALRPGTARFSVTVNGVTATHDITVTR